MTASIRQADAVRIRADVAALMASLDRFDASAAPASTLPMMADVIRWTSFQTGIPVSEILGFDPTQRLTRIRAAVAWFARMVLERSFPQIGRDLGGRHHSTIINLMRKSERLRDRDPAFVMLTARMVTHFLGDRA